MMKPVGLTLGAALLAAAAAAAAHDTWFQPLPAAAGANLLALGTGTEYPLQDSSIGREYLARQGCRGADERVATMQPLRNEPAALIVRAPRRAATCWAELTPFEIVLASDKIPVYLKDIHASPAIRAAWAAMHERGLPWRERYTKHARIELGAPSPAATPLGLDLHIEGRAVLQPGATLTAQLLRHGAPVAGLPLQLRSESSRLGIWRQTDAQGRVEFPLPLAGRWIVRGVDLHTAPNDPDRWESDFVTLAFEVPAADDQNGRNLRLNARSTSQVAATAAISSEPPISTARR